MLLALVLVAFAPDSLQPGNPYVLAGHTDTLTAIAFSPDSKRLASTSRDKTLKIWSLETGQPLQSLKLGIEQLSSIAWSPDGKQLAVGDVALSIQIVDVESGKVVQQLAHPDRVSDLAFSPDAKELAVGGVSDNGAIYELATGKKRFELKTRTVRYSADGKSVLVSSALGSFSVVDTKSGKPRRTVSTLPEVPLVTAIAGADLSLIASWSPSGTDVRLWNGEGKNIASVKGPALEQGSRRPIVTGCALLRDGKRVLVAAADGVVRLSALTGEGSVIASRWPSEKNTGLALSVDERWFATMDTGLIKLWKLVPDVR